ncbi:MAG: outer membrane protein transport protein [Bacteroidetes bacterium]|nr:outer membrane protein transport protein [Bacteroidota bacterium]MBU1115086.1 outer membrane protein transport protein [Bacteroidota bacterium]MBU1799006.1 outer membrane protein transport protein [Bacteroidota bacterium]
MKKKLRLLIVSFVVSTQLFASGFQINEHGARGMAMAGAYTALALDGSALYFNPAGLSQLNGTQIMVGATVIAPSSSFRGVSPAIDESSMKSAIFNPINIYLTHKLNEDWAFGFGVNNQYGLGSTWDENWVGKYLAIDTEIQTFYFTGAAAYKFSDKLSLGVTASYIYGNVAINKKQSLAPFNADATIDLTGTAGSFGYSVGLLYKSTDMMNIGFNFRSGSKLEFSGTADVTAPSALISLLPSGDVEAPLTTPYNATVGLALMPSKELTVSADFQYVGWSSYDKLEVTFVESGVISTSIRDYSDGWIARLGAEYHMSDEFDLRGGLLYDSNPVKDELVEPTLPDADRIGLNIGFGYKITPNLSIDLAYLFLRFAERKIENSEVDYTNGAAGFNGTYNSSAHLIGLNLSYYIN